MTDISPFTVVSDADARSTVSTLIGRFVVCTTSSTSLGMPISISELAVVVPPVLVVAEMTK